MEQISRQPPGPFLPAFHHSRSPPLPTMRQTQYCSWKGQGRAGRETHKLRGGRRIVLDGHVADPLCVACRSAVW